MSSADENFFPAVFVASVGRELGFPEERISDSFEKLEMVLSFLEARLEGRELEERGEVSLDRYPNVAAWMERIEARESFGAAT
jgi:glutathione S-transferase